MDAGACSVPHPNGAQKCEFFFAMAAFERRLETLRRRGQLRPKGPGYREKDDEAKYPPSRRSFQGRRDALLHRHISEGAAPGRPAGPLLVPARADRPTVPPPREAASPPPRRQSSSPLLQPQVRPDPSPGPRLASPGGAQRLASKLEQINPDDTVQGVFNAPATAPGLPNVPRSRNSWGARLEQLEQHLTWKSAHESARDQSIGRDSETSWATFGGRSVSAIRPGPNAGARTLGLGTSVRAASADIHVEASSVAWGPDAFDLLVKNVPPLDVQDLPAPNRQEVPTGAGYAATAERGIPADGRSSTGPAGWAGDLPAQPKVCVRVAAPVNEVAHDECRSPRGGASTVPNPAPEATADPDGDPSPPNGASADAAGSVMGRRHSSASPNARILGAATRGPVLKVGLRPRAATSDACAESRTRPEGAAVQKEGGAGPGRERAATEVIGAPTNDAGDAARQEAPGADPVRPLEELRSSSAALRSDLARLAGAPRVDDVPTISIATPQGNRPNGAFTMSFAEAAQRLEEEEKNEVGAREEAVEKEQESDDAKREGDEKDEPRGHDVDKAEDKGTRPHVVPEDKQQEALSLVGSASVEGASVCGAQTSVDLPRNNGIQVSSAAADPASAARDAEGGASQTGVDEGPSARVRARTGSDGQVLDDSGETLLGRGDRRTPSPSVIRWQVRLDAGAKEEKEKECEAAVQENSRLRRRLQVAEADLQRLSKAVDMMRRSHNAAMAALRAESQAATRGHAVERERLMNQASSSKAEVERLRHQRNCAETEVERLRRVLEDERRKSTGGSAGPLPNVSVRMGAPSQGSPEAVAPVVAKLEIQALQGADRETKAKLKKRLQLKWHPDKCMNSALATRVMQEMQMCPEWAS